MHTVIVNHGDIALEGLKAILESERCSPNDRDREGHTALHIAVILSRTKSIKYLISKDVDVNAPDGLGRTALMLACQIDNVATVKLLLKNGADPHLQDKDTRDASEYTKDDAKVNIRSMEYI